MVNAVARVCLRRACLFVVALCLASGLALPAHAQAWLRAESEHYIVHARLPEGELRDLMQSIEEFDRVLYGLMPAETRHGRKPEFYLTDRVERIAHVADFGATAVCQDHAELPVAYSLYTTTDFGQADPSEVFYCVTQFHLGNGFFRPKPMWVTGGLSHYFATASRAEAGVFTIGKPRNPRPVRNITSAALNEALLVRFRHRSEMDYARFLDLSRVIASPLLIEQQFAGVLDRYVNAYVTGRSMEDAASELGDLEALAAELAGRRIATPIRQVRIQPMFVADVTIRRMRRDEIVLIDLRIERMLETRLKSSARELGELTRRFPDSALVWYEYAAAEYARVQNSDFGGRPVFRGFGFSNGELIVMANPYSDAEAWRAVNMALTIDPDLAQARRLRAEILLSRLVREGNPDDAAAYDEVRAMLAPLARDPEREPLAAALYHQSYVEQDREPPEAALKQLRSAFLANAGVGDFRYGYATALSRRGEKNEARGLLISMLNDPAYQAAALRALEVTQ
jgi:hypothetical protein